MRRLRNHGGRYGNAAAEAQDEMIAGIHDETRTLTTLAVFCKALGWQGDTLQQAKERFAVASIREMDHVCGALVDALRDIADIENVRYFTDKRTEAVRMHNAAVR